MDTATEDLSMPIVALIAITRAALGAGIGLLLANRLSREQRSAAGWSLVTIGAISTIPLVLQVVDARHPVRDRGRTRHLSPEAYHAPAPDDSQDATRLD
jgi:hypothetical protein